MSQIEKKNQEFVTTNAAALDKENNQEFGYWKSLRDISTEEDYNRFLKQSEHNVFLLYTSPSPRDATLSRMPSSA